MIDFLGILVYLSVTTLWFYIAYDEYKSPMTANSWIGPFVMGLIFVFVGVFVVLGV